MSNRLLVPALLVGFAVGGIVAAPMINSTFAQTNTQPAVPPAAVPTPLPSAPAPTSGSPLAGRPDSFADLAAALAPSVVNISTTQTIKANTPIDGDEQSPDGQDGGPDSGQDDLPEMPQFPPGSPFEEFFKDFFDRHGQNMPGGQDLAPRRATSLGSGFVVDASGLVVTNNHVIENADEIKVILSDNTKLDATLVGKDPKTDLALLRVKTTHKLVPVKFADSDTARVGDWVLAIGNPFGLGGTVTAGIVSARARDINAGSYDDFIQTDASINRGNSGGPMFNMAGEVIGINTAIYSPSGGSVGIGFAIPANLAHPIIEQLKVSGNIKRGWIGVRIQNVTDDIAQSLGLPKTYGALVSSIDAAGPAAKAGIRQGDIVIGFNGHEVTEMRRLPRMVAETPLNSTVPVSVWRDGREVKLSIKIGEMPSTDTVASKDAKTDGPAEVKPTAQKVELLGLRLAAITPALRQRFELSDKVKGVLVLDVDASSDAAEKGIRPGDLIVEAGQAPTATVQDVISKVNSVGKGKPLLLLVERAGDARYVAIMLKK